MPGDLKLDLKEIVAQNRGGTPLALPSFCTANSRALAAVISFAATRDVPALIEATCNQVNQFGGYTGMIPGDFSKLARDFAANAGLPAERLILGGDHLGPNPWKHRPAEEAMQNAKAMVKDYVEAGFTKIHLDASMACAQEKTLSLEQVAERSAELCLAAEEHASNPDDLCYVIGTEVPVPGGETDDMSGIQVTTPERLQETIETHKAAFAKVGVPQGFERSIAVVVQPGVEFSQSAVVAYAKDEASGLIQAIEGFDGLAFETHSTDFQKSGHLRQLVVDRSAILKVGPEITFRFREAIVALDRIETLLRVDDPASILTAVMQAMEDDPSNWQGYYQGAPEDIEMLKIYSYSDRIRYYWDCPPVRLALRRLLENIRVVGIPAAIASQFGMRDPEAKTSFSPEEVIADRVDRTTERYYHATGWL